MNTQHKAFIINRFFSVRISITSFSLRIISSYPHNNIYLSSLTRAHSLTHARNSSMPSFPIVFSNLPPLLTFSVRYFFFLLLFILFPFHFCVFRSILWFYFLKKDLFFFTAHWALVPVDSGFDWFRCYMHRYAVELCIAVMGFASFARFRSIVGM